MLAHDTTMWLHGTRWHRAWQCGGGAIVFPELPTRRVCFRLELEPWPDVGLICLSFFYVPSHWRIQDPWYVEGWRLIIFFSLILSLFFSFSFSFLSILPSSFLPFPPALSSPFLLCRPGVLQPPWIRHYPSCFHDSLDLFGCENRNKILDDWCSKKVFLYMTQEVNKITTCSMLIQSSNHNSSKRHLWENDTTMPSRLRNGFCLFKNVKGL